MRRAQAVGRPPQSHAAGGVVQRVVVINQFGKNKQTRTFNVKNSKSQRSYPKSADYLIDLIKDKGFKAGWIGHVRNLVGEDASHPYDTIKDFVTDVAKIYPLADENKLQKRNAKRKLTQEHKDNLAKVDPAYYRPGKKLRRGSFVGTNKLTETLSQSKGLKQNITNLTTTSRPTDGGGKSLVLNTGNIFQSYLALSLANLDGDVRGAFLEGKYNRVNGGLGNSTGIRQQPFVEIPERLKLTVVHGDGAYEPGKIVGDELPPFENIRLGENTVPSEFRHLLVEEGKLKDTEEFNPVGKYALSEVPKATKGHQQTNQLMDQNAYRLYEEMQKLDHSTVIGRNSHLLPTGTTTTTISSLVNSFTQVTTNHTQQTQNDYHRQLFYITRSTYCPFYDENNSEYTPKTPPGSPFNPDYGYDK